MKRTLLKTLLFLIVLQINQTGKTFSSINPKITDPHNQQNFSLMQMVSKVSNMKETISTATAKPLEPTTSTESTLDAQTKPLYEWTVMLYIQAKNNLYQAAVENLHQVVKAFNASNVGIYIQWYQPHHEGIRRYHITGQGIKLEYCSDEYSENHTASELVDFVDWTVKKAPAKKYICILWNHGLGIIDPEWGNPIRVVQNPLEMIQGQRTHINDIVESLHFDSFSTANRGILFDESRRLYMNNQELVKAFDEIKTKTLNGKKIDIIGMDACYMQMLEVAHLMHPFAKYFIASEDVELAQGWNYPEIIRFLTSNPTCKPRQFAEHIISTYDTLYRGRTNLFTQSALKLSRIPAVKNKIDILAQAFLRCYEAAPLETKSIIRQARNRCQQFSMQTYIDLKSFCEETHKLLKPHTELYNYLNAPIKNSIAAIDDCVISNTSSTYFGKAYGMSILFPLYRIDRSYLLTPFAQNSLWLDFLYKSLLQ